MGAMPFKHETQLDTLNCAGIGITERDTHLNMLGANNIDILASQETHLNQNSTLKKNKYLYVFASDFTPKPIQLGQQKGRGIGKGKGEERRAMGARWSGFLHFPKTCQHHRRYFPNQQQAMHTHAKSKG